jgi:hypothetical protein
MYFSLSISIYTYSMIYEMLNIMECMQGVLFKMQPKNNHALCYKNEIKIRFAPRW